MTMRIIKGTMSIEPFANTRIDKANELATFLRGKGCIIDQIKADLDCNGDVEYLTISFYCAIHHLAYLKKSREFDCYGDCDFAYSFDSLYDIHSTAPISEEINSMLNEAMEYLEKAENITDIIRNKVHGEDERLEDYMSEIGIKLELLRTHLS